MTTDRSYIDLSGRVAIVTGGGNGIGRGIAHRLTNAGADVMVADIDVESARTVAEELSKLSGRSGSCVVDVSEQGSTDAMFRETMEKFGKVDILVNNAGIGGAPGWAEREEGSLEDWQRTFEVNVLGIVHSTKSVADHMTERGSGKIVNIASAAGRRGSPGFAHYSASKASAINVTQAWAYKLAPHKINVNSVCPGVLWTGLWRDIADRRLRMVSDRNTSGREYFESRFANMPLGREQTPEDIGNAVAFLASDRAKNITGQALNVDGGAMMN